MGKPRLANYVQKQLDAGYDINEVKKYLVRSGYDRGEVNKAVDYIYQKKPSGSTLPIAIIGVVGIVLVVVIGFVLFSGDKEEIPRQLLDLETSGLSNIVDAGSNLEFNVELKNMGNEKRYDIELTHELIDLRGQTITTKQETIAIETQVSKKSQITLPDDATGSYTLKTTASYNGQKARSFFTVIVKGVEEPEVAVVEIPEFSCPASCDDNDICTQDSCGSNTGYICFNQIITPCCGNNICESGEGINNCPNDCKEGVIDIFAGIETVRSVVEEAKELAASNPDQASNFCAGQERDNFKNNCYKAVAETARNSIYCEPIASDVTRDSCLTTAALTWNDFDVCVKITDKYLKIACTGYAQAEAATS